MPMIRLSIIIPHYNSVELLEKLLKSIPGKEEIQIIVIDDNSTEGRKEYECLMSRYPYVNFYRNESGKNSAGRCRNIGLEHAEGEWLLFADADDYFLDGFYDIAADYFDTAYDIVYFTPTSEDLQTGELTNRHEAFAGLVRDYCRQKGKRAAELRLRYYQEGPVSKLIRKSMVKDQGITFACTGVANDVMFSIRCAYAAVHIAAVEKEIYCITKGGGGLTTKHNKENFDTRLAVFIEKYLFLRKRLSKKDWKSIDLLGEHYIKLAKAYGLNKKEMAGVWWIFLKNRIRVFVSRKWTPHYLFKKMRGM